MLTRLPQEVFQPAAEPKQSRIISDMQHSANVPMSSLRKAYKKASNWSKQDIIDNFAASFIPDARKGEKTSRLFSRFSELEDEDELLSSLDEYAAIVRNNPTNALEESEKFIGEAISEIILSTNLEMNHERVVREPKRFFKAVPQSKLRKVLSSDPQYFNH